MGSRVPSLDPGGSFLPLLNLSLSLDHIAIGEDLLRWHWLHLSGGDFKIFWKIELIIDIKLQLVIILYFYSSTALSIRHVFIPLSPLRNPVKQTVVIPISQKRELRHSSMK